MIDFRAAHDRWWRSKLVQRSARHEPSSAVPHSVCWRVQSAITPAVGNQCLPGNSFYKCAVSTPLWYDAGLTIQKLDFIKLQRTLCSATDQLCRGKCTSSSRSKFGVWSYCQPDCGAPRVCSLSNLRHIIKKWSQSINQCSAEYISELKHVSCFGLSSSVKLWSWWTLPASSSFIGLFWAWACFAIGIIPESACHNNGLSQSKDLQQAPLWLCDFSFLSWGSVWTINT